MNLTLTLIAQALAFALFIWFTVKFIWPPLMRAIEQRQKQIADGLAAGEQGRRELEGQASARTKSSPGARARRRDHRFGGKSARRRCWTRRRPPPRPRPSASSPRQGRHRPADRPRQGNAEGAGRRARRRRRGENPPPRSERADPRRAARPAQEGNLTMAETATVARPYAEGRVRARGKGGGLCPVAGHARDHGAGGGASGHALVHLQPQSRREAALRPVHGAVQGGFSRRCAQLRARGDRQRPSRAAARGPPAVSSS